MQFYKRSPFLFIYWDERNRVIAFNYNRHTKAIISKEIIRILDTLSEWRSSREFFGSLDSSYDKKSLRKAMNQLVSLGIVYTKPVAKNDDNPPSRTYWNPVDLASQRQTSFGGCFPDLIKGKVPSAVKHVRGLNIIKLPNIKQNSRNGFYEILERRRSVRNYGKSHINIEKLSHFLYSCARIKRMFNDPVLGGQLTARPYPSGGARYPLEIYPVCNNINGVQEGLYYYDPMRHKLILLSKRNRYQAKFNELILRLQKPMINREPDVVFVVTAVFARTMWKYQNMGLSLIMKDLGCLYQTMYLVATEMNIAPCALGLSSEVLVREWLKLDWFVESHIGTFALGEKGKK